MASHATSYFRATQSCLLLIVCVFVTGSDVYALLLSDAGTALVFGAAPHASFPRLLRKY